MNVEAKFLSAKTFEVSEVMPIISDSNTNTVEFISLEANAPMIAASYDNPQLI